jgi:NADH-quinone oxidoreductase subunit G
VAAADNMVVRFDTPKVKEGVQGVLEFEFKNHPLDCPVCDQVGECYLQKYYIEVGRYQPLPIGRVRKDKVKDLGPITLDAERCVLCSRCVRFGEEISGSGDFVIASRSDHSEIMTFDDRPVGTAYALNYTDVCPVGALTSNDFRFRKRVYYLKTAKSVCPECSTGCNVYAEQSEDTLYRYRPRYNDQVNDSWMCDPGRLSYARMADTSDRLAGPRGKDGSLSWETALVRAVEALGELAGKVSAIASPRMSNEDLWMLRSLLEGVDGGSVDFRMDDTWRGVDELTDGVLIRRDPNPNTRGALEILALTGTESRIGEILTGSAGGGLIVFEWHLATLGDAGRAAVETANWVCFIGARENPLVDRADLVLPATVHVERDGTFTNWAGRVQRFWPVVPPYARSRPAWEILAEIRAGLGHGEIPPDAATAFRELAAAVPAFHGLNHTGIGDQGMWLRGWEKDAMPPVGVRPRPGVRAQQTF